MTKYGKTDFRPAVCILLTAILSFYSIIPAYAKLGYSSDFTTTTKPSTTEPVSDQHLADLQSQYDDLEQKINEQEQNIKDVEAGKSEQTKNINAINSTINDLNSQINILEERVNVLNSDITTLNSSIGILNRDITKLNTNISDTEDQIYELTKVTDILYGKIKGRLMINYMAGSASNLEVLLGVKDLPSLFTKLQIIYNLSKYDRKILEQFEANLATLQNLNTTLASDKTTLSDKQTSLTDQKNTLSARQSDIEASQYVLELKRKLSEKKYNEAVAYFKTLDETSADYNAMLDLLNKEQDKVDAEINAYLLKYGSSAEDGTNTESVTTPSGDGNGTTTTTKRNGGGLTSPNAQTGTGTTTGTSLADSSVSIPPTTAIQVVTPESIELIWPVPYKNCYISAPYGQYPSGGEHHGLDICVRGGSEGKNVVAAASGTVISYGFNHWSMGNYVIIDHGYGLFTAYYHMQKLYVAKGDRVQQGQTIGLIGHTGNTTGPHLHFEVRISRNGVIKRANPMKFVSLPS